MRVGYADPPYIGCAGLYPEKKEVDHRELLLKLQEYDGWALSASSPSLKVLIPMINAITDDYRIGAWVKPFASFKPNVNPAYAWEPVLFRPARGYDRADLTLRDWVSEVITLQRGMVGAKPETFCLWLFAILGAKPEDDFIDLFPGSGAVSDAWYKFSHQTVMALGV